MSHPVGDQADLRIGQVGDDVARETTPREIATHGQHGRCGDDDPVMARAPRDQATDHRYGIPGMSLFGSAFGSFDLADLGRLHALAPAQARSAV